MNNSTHSVALRRRARRRIPYFIAGIGIILSLIIWYYLSYILAEPLLTLLKDALPWIILILSIVLTITLAALVRYAQLMRLRSRSLNRANQNFKNEMVERIHAEQTKQKLEKALLQGQKLQAIGTLAGGIAHDFNNILYAINGYVEMAREDIEKDSLVFKNLGKVLEASQRGQDLIARILAFSRRQRHDYKPIPCQQTIEGVLSLLRPTIPAGVTLIFHTMPKDSIILADQTELHQVIVNIINNAVDAMDGEGVVTLRVQRIPANDEILKQIPNTTQNEYCKIEITDIGHGMDQSTIERIFEPFYTTKEVGKGTGLGLSTVHAIIKEHQGEILVKSQLGHGTTFTLLLPEYKENLHGENSVS